MYKILIVDDEIDVCNSCASLLSKRGNEVSVAISAEEALDKIKDSLPDVVLLDISMPGMGGMAGLKRIKEMNPLISVIMVTATEDAKVSDEAISLGASGYITKPVTADTLENLIKITRKMDLTKHEIDSEENADNAR